MEEGVNMSLIDKFVTACELLQAVQNPDGQGGSVTEWKNVQNFGAAFVKDQKRQTSTAEKATSAETYTVTVPSRIGLKFHDVIRRAADGYTFRVTSNSADSSPPRCASFRFEQVSAERWELP